MDRVAAHVVELVAVQHAIKYRMKQSAFKRRSMVGAQYPSKLNHVHAPIVLHNLSQTSLLAIASLQSCRQETLMREPVVNLRKVMGHWILRDIVNKSGQHGQDQIFSPHDALKKRARLVIPKRT